MRETTKTSIVVPRPKALLPTVNLVFGRLSSSSSSRKMLPNHHYPFFLGGAFTREVRAFISLFLGERNATLRKNSKFFLSPPLFAAKTQDWFHFPFSFSGAEKPTSFWTCRSPCRTPSRKKKFFFRPHFRFPLFNYISWFSALKGVIQGGAIGLTHSQVT